jgi:G3E family GTPase
MAEARSRDRRLPVMVLGGFLGSGKTTLLKRSFSAPGQPRTAFVINEFGRVGLDHRVVRETAAAAPAVISGGCVCCDRRPELVGALREIADRCDRGQAEVERVVLETSGLADPAPIVAAVASDPLLRHRFVVDRVTVTLDGVNGRADLAAQPEAYRQVAVADELIITKVDLTTPEEVSALAEAARRLNPAAAISVAAAGAVEPRPRWPASTRPGAPAGWPADACTNHDGVAAVCVVREAPLDWVAFSVWLSMLLHARGDEVLRVKGIVDVDGGGPVAINGVQHVIHAPEHLAPDAAGSGTELVFITRGIAPGLIERSLDTFDRLAARGRA